MKVNELFMKRLFVIFVLIVAAALVLSACRRSRGGDDGAPPPQPPQDIVEEPLEIPQTLVTFESPLQAAGEVTAALNTKALVDAQFAAAMSLGLGSRPVGDNFAPGLAGDIGRIDPTLKMMVDKMTTLTRSAAVQKAVRRAVALKAMRAPVDETVTVGFCDNAEGKIQIKGTNNYDDLNAVVSSSSYDITFTECRDEILATELDGTLHIEENESIEGLASALSLTASITVDLTESVFEDETFAVMTEQAHLSGTYSDFDLGATGSMSAAGQFSLTTPPQGTTPELVVNHTFTGLTIARTTASDAASTTVEDTVNGFFTTGRFIGGTEVFKTTLQLTDLVDRVQAITGPAGDPAVGTKSQTINGTLGAAWAPEVAGCLPGLMKIETTTPRTFAAGDTCPSAGTMTINNAIITFGSPILVTLTNSVILQTFADCDEMAATGAACVQ